MRVVTAFSLMIIFLSGAQFSAAEEAWNDFALNESGKSAVRIVKKSRFGRDETATAVAISNQHLLLPLGVARDEEILSDAEGLQLVTKFEDLNLALFFNPKGEYVPATIASELGSEGRNVHVVIRDQVGLEVVSGTILSLASQQVKSGNYIDLSVANSSIASLAAPVFNNCGELVGIFDAALDSDVTTSVGLEAILEVTRGRDGIQRASSVCPSELRKRELIAEKKEEELEATKLEAEAKQAEIEASVEELKKQKAELERSKATALESAQEENAKALDEKQQELDSIQQEVDAKAAEIESAKAEAEAAQLAAREAQEEIDRLNAQAEEAEQKAELEASERAQQQEYIVYGVIAILVIGLVVILFRRRASHVDSSPKEENDDDLYDVVLKSAEFSVKLHAQLLNRERGAVLGRSSAESDFVVDAPSISRAHCRLSIVDQILYVEDLGSANGTFVNGRKLTPGERSSLRGLDELQLADTAFSVGVM